MLQPYYGRLNPSVYDGKKMDKTTTFVVGPELSRNITRTNQIPGSASILLVQYMYICAAFCHTCTLYMYMCTYIVQIDHKNYAI